LVFVFHYLLTYWFIYYLYIYDWL